MAEIKFNFEQYDGQIAKSCMVRLRKAANVIADKTKDKYGTLDIEGVRHVGGMRYRTSAFFHGVYKKGENEGVFWTARTPLAMRNTIRVTEKKDQTGNLIGQSVRVIVGNKKTWWAIQMERGRGAWRGGAKPFFRSAIGASKSDVQRIIENG